MRDSAHRRPLVAPVWFVVDGGELAFNTGKNTAKGRALLPDNQIVIFDLKGAGIENGQRGTLEWTIDVTVGVIDDAQVEAARRRMGVEVMEMSVAPSRILRALSQGHTIGIVGAMPIPEVNRIVNAFVLGVKETNPQATVKVSFINTFFDPAAAKQAAQAHISAGADVMFAERDGVIAAAEEADLPVVGMMVDQKEEAPEHVVTSLIWHMRPTVDAVVEQAKNGPEAVDLGTYSFMKEGGSELAPINTDIVGGVPDALVKQVEEKRQAIMDGSFTTPVDESAPAGSIDVSKL